jgi:hypothetical protein
VVIDQEPTSTPNITLGFDPRDFDQATIDAVAENLSANARVSIGRVHKFSDEASAVTFIIELLMNTLTGIGSNAIYDALRPLIARTNRLTLRMRLWPEGDSGNRKGLEVFIDVNDAESFSQAVDSVSGLLDRHGWRFTYDSERKGWDDIS